MTKTIVQSKTVPNLMTNWTCEGNSLSSANSYEQSGEPSSYKSSSLALSIARTARTKDPLRKSWWVEQDSLERNTLGP